MNKISTYIIIVVIVVLIALGVYAYFMMQNNSPALDNSTSATDNVAVVNQPTNPAVKFLDSADAPSAYLISTDTYDAKTKLALTGFNVKKLVQSDGSVQYTLSATEPGYQTQVFNVKAGQKLYFVERFLQDDQNEKEANLKDDLGVLVDENGYIVQ